MTRKPNLLKLVANVETAHDRMVAAALRMGTGETSPATKERRLAAAEDKWISAIGALKAAVWSTVNG